VSQIYTIMFAISVLLLIIFFVTYILNKKTPKPEGCEDILISDENCGACNNTACSIKTKLDLEKIQKEIDELESNDNKEDK